MRERRARDILLALLEGIHPATGEALAFDSVLQSAGVLRALLAGATALDVAENRAARRSHLPTNVGRSWTSSQIANLRSEFEAGNSIEDIALSSQALGLRDRALAREARPPAGESQ